MSLFHLHFVPGGPDDIFCCYGREPLTRGASAFLDQVASQDDVAKSISKRLNVIQRGAEEAGNVDAASVRHLVGLVLDAADLDDGGNFELLPQRAIRHAIAGHSYESMPGFILRSEVDTIELITHERQARGCTDKTWAQISGEIDGVWTTATQRSANKSCTCWLLPPLKSVTGMQLLPLSDT